MNDQAIPASRPWRRFLRFSVRGLVVVVLLLGCWLGWIVRGARIQREAVAAIDRAGGSVTYEWNWQNGHDTRAGGPRAPRWLVDLVGVDYFGHVAAVWLCTEWQVTDITLTQVGRLTHLKRLCLSQAFVDNAALAHLKHLTELERLDLDSTSVNDDALSDLPALTHLAMLDLDHARVSDAGLVRLKKQASLSELILSYTKITDAGLVHLEGLTKLRKLSLGYTQVTDAGLRSLEGLTFLSELHVGGAQGTAAGVTELQEALPNLKIAF